MVKQLNRKPNKIQPIWQSQEDNPLGVGKLRMVSFELPDSLATLVMESATQRMTGKPLKVDRKAKYSG